MTSRLGDPKRVGPQSWIVGNEDVGALGTSAGLPAHEATDGLTEEQFGCDRRRVDPDSQAWNVDTFGNHSDRDKPRTVVIGEGRDLRRCAGVVTDDHIGADTQPIPKQSGDPVCVVNVGGDHESAGVRVGRPDRPETLICLGEHLREPVAVEAECRTQS